ncbi:hypothetical protein PAXRUDRAFT_827944 [Paxillus rubicundulus Ve08.2h10]|uniref:Uncharacterized protein n=1 Tax=Paxillus rubicundulus Ve08.2h10 TaxID=930991 RepID=A0A0D0DBF8_9AGAM|nr:hypothetical protein PAXRUDRAFT_827944 [Paxillus rubicundulus Ve08.2h10]
METVNHYAFYQIPFHVQLRLQQSYPPITNFAQLGTNPAGIYADGTDVSHITADSDDDATDDVPRRYNPVIAVV